MTFDSLTFFCFLTATLVVHWLVSPWHMRKLVLLVASYMFYAAWNPFFVLLLVTTTWFDFLLARWMDQRSDLRIRKRFLLASIVVNLGVLAFFKYAQFLGDIAIDLAALAGVQFHPINLGILLPIGISFYTFESMSYVIDVYKRRFKAATSLVDYSLFVTFFPHLVAGPILRYQDFSPQCEQPKAWNAIPAGRALAMLAVGLALKVCLADLVFSPLADRVFAVGARPDATAAWVGAAAFSLQVYCDFSGYSLCAIGSALLFGFQFRTNFESPFGSVGMADLWTRWHISLSTWLRDYVFNPLGGYRKGRTWGHINLIATFLICGLWHGAAWTYVIWGGLNGLFQVLERVVRDRIWDFTRAKGIPARSLLMLVTFCLFTVAVVFFRAATVGDAVQMIGVMMTGAGNDSALVLSANECRLAIIVGVGVLVAHQISAGVRGWEWLDAGPIWRRAGLVSLALGCVVLSPGFNPAFIYFQF